jgi:hypothetical protein
LGSKLDLTGQIFGRLTVLYEHIDESNARTAWVCQCNCENKTIVVVTTQHLRNGGTKSCECIHKETVKKNGKSNKKENIYKQINEKIGNCFDPSGENFLFEFDWEDLELIEPYCWSLGTRKYIHSRTKDKNNKGHLLQLHRLILSNFYKIEYENLKRVDHKDRNPQNNKKENLRLVTHSQNMMNRKLNKNNKTGVKGVEIKKDCKYLSSITVNNVVINLGTYDNLEDAKNARIEAEIKYFGEYRNSEMYEK